MRIAHETPRVHSISTEDYSGCPSVATVLKTEQREHAVGTPRAYEPLRQWLSANVFAVHDAPELTAR